MPGPMRNRTSYARKCMVMMEYMLDAIGTVGEERKMHLKQAHQWGQQASSVMDMNSNDEINFLTKLFDALGVIEKQ